MRFYILFLLLLALRLLQSWSCNAISRWLDIIHMQLYRENSRNAAQFCYALWVLLLLFYRLSLLECFTFFTCSLTGYFLQYFLSTIVIAILAICLTLQMLVEEMVFFHFLFVTSSVFLWRTMFLMPFWLAFVRKYSTCPDYVDHL